MFDTDEHLEDSTIEALKRIPAVYRVVMETALKGREKLTGEGEAE